MTREDIIRMAREANIKQAIETPHLLMVHELERFAALVAAAERKKVRSAMKKAHLRMSAHLVAAEREACAELCERMARRINSLDIRTAALEMAAENIRARGQA